MGHLAIAGEISDAAATEVEQPVLTQANKSRILKIAGAVAIALTGAAAAAAVARSRSGSPLQDEGFVELPSSDVIYATGVGCGNWAAIKFDESNQDNLRACASHCEQNEECVGFNFQYLPTEECNFGTEGFEKNTCYLYNALCEVERNSCWVQAGLYRSEPGAGSEPEAEPDQDALPEVIEDAPDDIEVLPAPPPPPPPPPAAPTPQPPAPITTQLPAAPTTQQPPPTMSPSGAAPAPPPPQTPSPPPAPAPESAGLWICPAQWYDTNYGTPTDGEAKEWTMAQNVFRCMHDVPFTLWSNPVADGAKAHVETLTTMAHSDSYNVKPPAGPAGENLFQGFGASFSPGRATSDWYKEIKDCETLPGCEKAKPGTQVGHFTAMIWKGELTLGCYSNDDGVKGCRYKAGDTNTGDTPNMGGHYTENVVGPTRAYDECKGLVEKCFGETLDSSVRPE